jgi:transposase-like protein
MSWIISLYTWSVIDVDSGEIPTVYASWSRNMLIATRFLKIVPIDALTSH